MTYLYWIMTIFMVVALIFRLRERYARYKAETKEPPIVVDPEPNAVEYDYAASYQKKKRLLTEEEKDAYFKVKEIADNLGLHLFAKVRLCDLIEPKRGDEHFLGAERMLQSELVDFVVCDGALSPRTIIELGGSKRQKERDDFVHAALQAAEFNVIRLQAVSADALADLLAQS